MKVILVSGKARSGKDYVAKLLKTELEKKTGNGRGVLIIHYADALKVFCREHFGWDGTKSETSRSLLQGVGTEIARANYEDTWVDVVIALLRGFASIYDYVIIPDVRFKNEIEKPQKYFDCITVRVNNSHKNNLTEEQRKHKSETDLDDYPFQFVLKNNYDDTINEEIQKLLSKLISE